MGTEGAQLKQEWVSTGRTCSHIHLIHPVNELRRETLHIEPCKQLMCHSTGKVAPQIHLSGLPRESKAKSEQAAPHIPHALNSNNHLYVYIKLKGFRHCFFPKRCSCSPAAAPASPPVGVGLGYMLSCMPHIMFHSTMSRIAQAALNQEIYDVPCRVRGSSKLTACMPLALSKQAQVPVMAVKSSRCGITQARPHFI